MSTHVKGWMKTLRIRHQFQRNKIWFEEHNVVNLGSETMLLVKLQRIMKDAHLIICFLNTGNSHCRKVLTRSKRVAETRVLHCASNVVVDGSVHCGVPWGLVKFDSKEDREQIKPSMRSGSTIRISLRISRSVMSSGVSRALAPYRVTFRWFVRERVELANGIQLRKRRWREPTSWWMKISEGMKNGVWIKYLSIR